MDEEKGIKTEQESQGKEILSKGTTYAEGTPSQGTDFWAKFNGLNAGIVGIKGGKLSRAKIERKRLDKAVKTSMPSSVIEIGDVTISVEVGTGDTPDIEGESGPLVVYDAGRLKKRTYADAYLSEVGEENCEAVNIITKDYVFAINSKPVEETWNPETEPLPEVGYATTTP